MSYIGNAKTPLLLASNVRDDLIPDGIKTVFELSQEVPGGEGINVCVVRRRFLTDSLVENTDLIQFIKHPDPLKSETQSQIIVYDNHLAAALSIITPNSAEDTQDGDSLKLTYADNSTTDVFPVESVVYTRDSITITVFGTVDDIKYIEVGTTIKKLERQHYGPWEILDPESQYEIISTLGFTNRKIEIKDLVPTINDVLYVLHRGEGTYNFVPSPFSVGPEQLSPNLRNFAVDVETYNTTGEKTLTLSQVAPVASTLLVTIDGAIQTSTNEMKQKDPNLTDQTNPGTWTLNSANGTTQTITLKSSLFTNAASLPVTVRVLHLTFSTIARRASFAPGQDEKFIRSGSVTADKLSQDAVTTVKIKDNSVTGSKILIPKTQALRFSTTETEEIQVLSLNQTTNDTQLKSSGSIEIVSGTQVHKFTATDISPSNTSTNVSLGTAGNKYQDLHIKGTGYLKDIEVESIEVTGNIKITGTIDNTDVSDLRSDVDALETKVNEIVKFLIPIGTIVPTAGPTPPVSTTYGEWILCDGRTLERSRYPDLYTALGGETQRAAGWPWGSCTDTSFSIPDLRRRAAVGKSSGDLLGASEGQATPAQRLFEHTHTGAEHTHTISHTHTIPGHKHTINPTAAGSLSISSSGAHSTDITHAHNQGTLQTNDTPIDHQHYLTHGHGNASSKYTTDNGGVDHSHAFYGSASASGSGTTDTNSSPARRVGAASGGIGVSAFDSGTTGNGHQHTFSVSVSGSCWGSTQNASAVAHGHTFFIPTQTDASTTAIISGAYNNLSHKHTFSIPSTSLDRVNSLSSGAHDHAASSFSGFIGTATSSPEGNSNLTTTAQSTDVTGGTSYGSNRTGSATVPYLVVNYMIRAA
jgi:hypothetical protein